MQQARTSLLAAHSGSQFLATQAALLQGTHPAHPASVFLNNSLQQQVSYSVHSNLDIANNSVKPFLFTERVVDRLPLMTHGLELSLEA